MSKEVKPGLFVEVLDGSFGEYGVKKGDLVYVAGETTIQTDAHNDPYALRKLFIAAFLKDKHLDLDKKPFMIDGKRLKPVSAAKQNKLDQIRQRDFKELEDESTD